MFSDLFSRLRQTLSGGRNLRLPPATGEPVTGLAPWNPGPRSAPAAVPAGPQLPAADMAVLDRHWQLHAARNPAMTWPLFLDILARRERWYAARLAELEARVAALPPMPRP